MTEQNKNDIVAAAIVNIYTKSKEAKNIILKKVNLENKEHMLILQCAISAAELYSFGLYLDLSLSDRRKLKEKYPKLKWRKTSRNSVGIDVNELIDFMKKPLVSDFGENFFEEIYEEYFK